MNAILTVTKVGPATLGDELAAYGIPILSPLAVLHHKLNTSWRSGWNRVMGIPVAVGIFGFGAFVVEVSQNISQNTPGSAAMVSFYIACMSLGLVAVLIRERWRRVSFKQWMNFWNDSVLSPAPPMPRHLRKRVGQLQSLRPDLKLDVDVFGADPFLSTKEPGFFKQRYYIGAWGTGAPEFDDA